MSKQNQEERTREIFKIRMNGEELVAINYYRVEELKKIFKLSAAAKNKLKELNEKQRVDYDFSPAKIENSDFTYSDANQTQTEACEHERNGE